MKQMMNKTVLIQNQDYKILNNPLTELVGSKISKKNSNFMVSLKTANIWQRNQHFDMKGYEKVRYYLIKD